MCTFIAPVAFVSCGPAEALTFALRRSGFLFGYDIGVIVASASPSETEGTEADAPSQSGCLIMPGRSVQIWILIENGTWFLSATRQSEITSLLSAGTFFGALGQAFTADTFGRKGSVLFWSVIFTVGVVIQTATNRNLGQILFGRFAAGLLYNGEAAPKHLRGTLLVLYQVREMSHIGSNARLNFVFSQLMIISGIFLSYILDLATHSINIPVGIQILWGLVLIGGILILPESPRHLLFKNRIPEARTAIAAMNDTTPDSALVDDIMAELDEGIRAENEGGKAGWLECFSPSVRMRTINGMMIQFLQQLNGQNFYYYYGDTFVRAKLGVYLGESFPLRVRAKCIALGAATIWFWNFMLSYFSPRIAKDIGPLILLIFAGMLLVAFIYVYFFLPEVKGLSLEQVDELARSGVKPWNSANWQPTHGTTRKGAFQRTYYKSEQADMDKADAERIEAAKASQIVPDAEKASTDNHVEKTE
ncbi:hypothetical protein RQP46_002211 [Phenoliferia psychrophenolica]